MAMTSGIITKFLFAVVAASMPAALQLPQPSQPQQDRSTRIASSGKQNGTGNGQSRPATPNSRAPQVQPPKPPPEKNALARPRSSHLDLGVAVEISLVPTLRGPTALRNGAVHPKSDRLTNFGPRIVTTCVGFIPTTYAQST